MDRTAALQQLKPRIEEYLQGKGIDTRHNFKCLNPAHQENNPSMGLDRVNHQAHCFTISCGARYDIIDLIKLDNPGLDTAGAFEMAYRLYNIDAGGPTADFQPVQNEQKAPKYADKIERYAVALKGSEGETYLTGRGLSIETMRRFKLGYSPEEYNKPLGKPMPSITIPYPGADYYISRPISEKAYDKPKTSEAGPEPIFNLPALYSGAQAVFIVESQLCAISIEQAGGSAIALGGGGLNRLIQQLKAKPTSAALILCLDNDAPGREAVVKAGAGELSALFVNGSTAIMGVGLSLMVKTDL
ncbi:MAG: DNA primase [Firmicutes bacterium ADurb.Bin373]|nr:MAG: DNA primase [Firmicutes bacterium ADurb.Bin373]